MSDLNIVERVIALEGVELLQNLGPEQLARIGAIAHEVKVPPGKTILEAGKPIDALYIIVDGAVELSRDGEALTTARQNEVRFRSLVQHCERLADYGEALLRRSGRFEILSGRSLSIVCFRYVPHEPPSPEALDQLNLTILDKLRAGGRAFLSTTRLQGRVTLRFCFINWRTTARDVEEVVELLTGLANGII